MEATVDVARTDGRVLADASHASIVSETRIFEQDNSAADAEVRKLIAANGVRPARLAVARVAPLK
jgi:membrane fusion protein, multidrug efflux system